MSRLPFRKSTAVLLALAWAGLFLGWREFWFLTDDAFIAFRYVSNSLLGYGYTWNPPPFRAVDGYTSWLWVVLLDGVWRVLGVEPPRSANVLSLIFAAGTIAVLTALSTRAVAAVKLPAWRVTLVALVLMGTLTNRTFLAWTSSGLETALYGFTMILWVYMGGRFAERRDLQSSALWGASAALACVTRPDALPAAGMTGLVLAVWLLRHRGRSSLLAAASGVAALMGPLGAFSLWKYFRYGSMLPNTYYAKVAKAWPEAGLRYVASFTLEYALWFWLLVVIVGVVFALRARWRPHGPLLAAVVAFSYQFGYYALVTGGDHFEYKAFAHLVPFFYISFAWALAQMRAPAGAGVLVYGTFLGMGWLIPWTHYIHTRGLTTRDETFMLRHQVKDELPAPARFYGAWFDELQGWLIGHFIGMRHQEHKVFFIYKEKTWPSRREGSKIPYEGFPVDVEGEAGYAGWSLEHVAILDAFALNDYYGARNPHMQGGPRRLAHSRMLPPHYVDAFRPNVRFDNGRWRVQRRDKPLTAGEIVDIQNRYDRWLLDTSKEP